jgi:hypothetical protein
MKTIIKQWRSTSEASCCPESKAAFVKAFKEKGNIEVTLIRNEQRALAEAENNCCFGLV